MKGETIFNEFNNLFYVKAIPLSNILSFASDSALTMVGQDQGFLAYLKQFIPNVLSVHYAIYQQHLVKKKCLAKNLSERLHGSPDYVIRAVNKIKRNALNERLFTQLCLENNEDYSLLLLTTYHESLLVI